MSCTVYLEIYNIYIYFFLKTMVDDVRMVMIMADAKPLGPRLLPLAARGMALPLRRCGLSPPARRQEFGATLGYRIVAALGAFHELHVAIDHRPLLSSVFRGGRMRRGCHFHLLKHLSDAKLSRLDRRLAIRRPGIVVHNFGRARAKAAGRVAANCPRAAAGGRGLACVHRAAKAVLKRAPFLAWLVVLLAFPAPIP